MMLSLFPDSLARVYRDDARLWCIRAYQLRHSRTTLSVQLPARTDLFAGRYGPRSAALKSRAGRTISTRLRLDAATAIPTLERRQWASSWPVFFLCRNFARAVDRLVKAREEIAVLRAFLAPSGNIRPY